MGCYPCTIKWETNFYQQKQGYPHDYRGYPHDHIDFTDKNTKKTHSAPEYTRGPRQGDIFCPRVYSGAAFKGLKLNVVLFTSLFLKWTIFDLPAFIRMCHFWHQELTQLSNSCKSASLSAINAKSSAYRRWDNIISGPICTPTLRVFSSFDKSFIKNV